MALFSPPTPSSASGAPRDLAHTPAARNHLGQTGLLKPCPPKCESGQGQCGVAAAPAPLPRGAPGTAPSGLRGTVSNEPDRSQRDVVTKNKDLGHA